MGGLRVAGNRGPLAVEDVDIKEEVQEEALEEEEVEFIYENMVISKIT